MTAYNNKIKVQNNLKSTPLPQFGEHIHVKVMKECGKG
jgi:hypothetical protein